MHSPVTYVHLLLQAHLRQGDVAIDATVGNGNDTLVLASLVGPSGIVIGFDVQQIALDVAAAKLASAGHSATLLLSGHEHMEQCLPTHVIGRIRAVTFNLGYLPGANHTITTLVDTTARAIDAAIRVLAPDGMITIVCYKHDEGRLELEAVRAMLQSRRSPLEVCVETSFINRASHAPVVFVYRRFMEPDTMLRR